MEGTSSCQVLYLSASSNYKLLQLTFMVMSKCPFTHVLAVANAGFPREGGRHPKRWEWKPIILGFSLENCMKLKKNWTGFAYT